MNAHCPIPVNFVEGFLDSIRRGGGRRLFQDLELRRAFGGIGNQKRVECFTKFGGQKSLCVSPQDFGCGKPGGRDIAFKKIKTRAENLLIPQSVGGHPQQSQGTVVFEGALGEPFNQQVTIGAGLSPEPEGGHGFQPVVGSGPGTLPVGRAAFGGNADLSREETERLLGNSSRFIGKKPRYRRAQRTSAKPSRFPSRRLLESRSRSDSESVKKAKRSGSRMLSVQPDRRSLSTRESHFPAIDLSQFEPNQHAARIAFRRTLFG